MLLSHLFTRTSYQAPADADCLNARLLTRAGYIQKTMAGVYSYLPLGLRVLRNIEQIVREEMDAIGGQEVLMSGLSPREGWEKTGRWEGFNALFRVPGAAQQEYALNPTHEEVIVPLVQRFVSSYKDLPFACYQIQTKFRNEPRAKSGVLRGREFLMKDLYSFHRDTEDLEHYYTVVQGAYRRIFERLELGDRTYYTCASGGSFSQYSHEYQVLLPQGEDDIFINVDEEKKGNRLAENREIYKEGHSVTGGNEFREERASEAANIFKLGTRFSEPFALQFTDEHGALHYVVMGSYGVGISRLLGIIAEAFADEHGLVWPLSVAPACVLIVPLVQKTEESAFQRAEGLYRLFQKEGMAALLDDRLGLSAGSRFADADLLGIPLRVVLSSKTIKAGKLEVKDRRTGEVQFLTEGELLEVLKNRSAGS